MAPREPGFVHELPDAVSDEAPHCLCWEQWSRQQSQHGATQPHEPGIPVVIPTATSIPTACQGWETHGVRDVVH